jgi:hypothetical protein
MDPGAFWWDAKRGQHFIRPAGAGFTGSQNHLKPDVTTLV